ncbi:hypothetical protein AMST5_02811 [freshwater sediment metagenome]|uniref:Uncharacterized protein n=1 Tax=freshwater sediment metagenome TaxID=556182 RepID=A0AA48M439_9ZZZZ
MTSTIELARSSKEVHQALLKDYARELFATLESLSISAGEAAYRDNFTLASMHFDSIKLIGKELVSTFRQLDGSAQ